MIPILVALTDESQFGRLDYALLPDQALMEMLVDGFSETIKERYLDKNGMFLDVCDWGGVVCDDDANVKCVESFYGDGSISLEFIPPKVGAFFMNVAKLSGTFSASTLPEGMEYFEIGDNSFKGTVDFTSLPETMQQLSLYYNFFTGSAELDSLPKALTRLWVQHNEFSGSLNLTKLPPNFEYLDASSNAFSGKFRLENVPKNTHTINASENRFDEVAIVPSNVCDVYLRGSGVTSVVDEDGKTHPEKRVIISQERSNRYGIPNIS